MTGNRVEKLESRVEELEASVSGLTEELMQTKAHLADLEDDPKDDDIEAGVGSNHDSASSPSEEANSTDDETEDTETKPPEADDIIVA